MAGMKKPEHHCNVVPAEMHQRMMDERDKKIAELQEKLTQKTCDRCGAHDHDHCFNSKPQPAREKWWLAPFFLMIAYGLGFFLAWSFFRYYPAAPEGTGNATGYHDGKDHAPMVLSSLGDYNIVRDERDHWLRNCKMAWKAADCDHAMNSIFLMQHNVCKVLDQ